jgi:hypothetical protein
MIYGVLPSDYTLFVTQLARSVQTVLESQLEKEAAKEKEKEKTEKDAPDESREGNQDRDARAEARRELDMALVFRAWENVFTLIAEVMYLYVWILCISCLNILLLFF